MPNRPATGAHPPSSLPKPDVAAAGIQPPNLASLSTQTKQTPIGIGDDKPSTLGRVNDLYETLDFAASGEILDRAPALAVEDSPSAADHVIDPIQMMPPWLISLVVHMVGMIILGLLTLPQVVRSSIEMAASFADTIGQQLEADVTFSPVDVSQFDEPILANVPLPKVEQPLLRPDSIAVPDGGTASSELESPAIGIALTGREPGMKEVLLAAYGGNQQTESAVVAGLEWLRRNQRSDGTWSLTGPYSDGAHSEDITAATAMALLAFQGAGHTHDKGRYKTTVNQAWKAMLRMQKADGDFWKGTMRHYRLYAQAQATIAVCEMYGMTDDSRFRLAAQKAVDYAVRIQDRAGGWRYEPGSDSDTSVTGWFVMALQSARMAGIDVPTETWARVSQYLDSAGKFNGSVYAYQPGEEPSYSMTAEALLCRQYLGWPRDDKRLRAGVDYLTALPLDWNDKNVYYWYYATQVLHHLGGPEWKAWNESMRELLPQQQTRSGPEQGSWSPMGDEWGSQGGRLYTTCLSLCMLEVYYRHLPIYESIYEVDRTDPAP
jgi:hypothetical protein